MKNLSKRITSKLGYKIVSNYHYSNLFDLRNITELDCFYLLNRIYNRNDKLDIFDIGANEGQTAIKFHNYFPHSNIYCFEPISTTSSTLRGNLDNIPNCKLFKSAIGSKDDEIGIFFQENNQWNSLVPEINKSLKRTGQNSEKIKTTSSDIFATEHKIKHIDIVKSDTEGYELEVIKGAENLLNNQLIDVLYFEVGFNKSDIGHTYWIDLIESLKEHYIFSGFFEMAYTNYIELDSGNALFLSKNFIKTKKTIY